MPGLSRAQLLALTLPGAAVLVLFFAIPLMVVVAEAFRDGGAAFARILADPVFWRGLRGSVLLSLSASAFSLAAGFLVALRISQLGPALRTALMFFISLPLTFSGLIIAYGFILVFGRAGFLTLMLAELGVDPARFAGFIYSPAGLAFAYSYYLIPRVVLLLLPVLLNFDRAQLAAAESLGATRLRALCTILIPQVAPAGIAAFSLIAAVALGAYGTALALVGTQLNILPLVIYSRISETGSDFPSAAALSLVLMALCSLVMAGGEVSAMKRAQ
jgi:putative spermidine/putrescine transport system permease protein